MSSDVPSTARPLYAAVAKAPPLHADTVDARCDTYPKGEDRASGTMPCTFSQRQGYIHIHREDGVEHDLSPKGDKPGNYTDQAGNPVYRQSGLGKDGLIFRLPKELVYVYWDAFWGDSGDANPTDPYTTADYDATTILRCSRGMPSHDRDCPAGIHRGDADSASIRVTGPGGSERALNFSDGEVTTPGGGDLTWGKQGDDWYIGIDDKEFYIVPETAVKGG